MIELALQALVAVLLTVMIVYAFALNRRLSRLRDGREEMQRLIAELASATANAEKGVASLRKTAFEDNEALGRRIADARTARDEIGFLVDRAEVLSARLGKQIDDGRPSERRAAEEAGTGSVSGPARGGDRISAAGPANDAGVGTAENDIEAARAARATATAWLRNRRDTEPAVAAGATPPHGLR